MWRSEVSVDIDCGAEAVYDRLYDLSRHAEFTNGLAAIEKTTEGPVRVGSQYRAQETVPGRFTSFAEITELERPARIGWKAWVPGTMRTRWQVRIEPAGAGSHVVETCEFEALSPIGWVMLNVHRKRNVPRENRRFLEAIKQSLESRAAQEAAS